MALKRQKGNKKLFEKGETNVFELESKNIGDIKKINLSHDGKGIGAGWHVERIEVKSNGDTKMYFNIFFDISVSFNQVKFLQIFARSMVGRR